MTKPSLEVMSADATTYGSTNNRGKDEDVVGETSPLVHSINDSIISQADAETSTHPSGSKSRRWIVVAATFLVAFAFMGMMSSHPFANKVQLSTAQVDELGEEDPVSQVCAPAELESKEGCSGEKMYRKCDEIEACVGINGVKACRARDYCGCGNNNNNNNNNHCKGCPGGMGYETDDGYLKCESV